MMTVRLNEDLERALQDLASKEGMTKSQLVRQCLEEFVTRKKEEKTPWELGEHLFGKHGSGQNDLSTNRKKVARDKIHTKHRSR